MYIKVNASWLAPFEAKTYGPFVVVSKDLAPEPGHKNSAYFEALLAHEFTHVRQWFPMAMSSIVAGLLALAILAFTGSELTAVPYLPQTTFAGMAFWASIFSALYGYGLLYRLSAKFRFEAEIRCYAVQLQTLREYLSPTMRPNTLSTYIIAKAEDFAHTLTTLYDIPQDVYISETYTLERILTQSRD